MSEWIKCSEELPENNRFCLVWAPSYPRCRNAIFDKDGNRWWVSLAAGALPDDEKPTHWMPLPQPPQE